MLEELTGTPARAVGTTPPWLALWSDDGRCRTWVLDGASATVGRSEAAAVVLDDPLVSRLHLLLERIAGVWTVSDHGLSTNGTFVNGVRVQGRYPVRDRDQLRLGGTVLTFCHPDEGAADPTLAGQPVAAALQATPAQRAVLQALCRPYREGLPYPAPATNAEIATALVLSVDAVKTHLRALAHQLGLDALPQNRKRSRLAEIAVQFDLDRAP